MKLTMQEILRPSLKNQMAGSGNSLRKVAHNTCSMLDYRNSVQIVNVTNLGLHVHCSKYHIASFCSETFILALGFIRIKLKSTTIYIIWIFICLGILAN